HQLQSYLQIKAAIIGAPGVGRLPDRVVEKIYRPLPHQPYTSALSQEECPMPVYVESVTNPSDQDHTDLARIYADAPAWLFAPHADAEALVAAGVAQGALIAGRFNDRLLGAALLERFEDRWRLSHLCVRNITRGRGVARRLLDEARRRAGAAGTPLHLAAPADHLESQALAARTQLPLEAL